MLTVPIPGFSQMALAGESEAEEDKYYRQLWREILEHSTGGGIDHIKFNSFVKDGVPLFPTTTSEVSPEVTSAADECETAVQCDLHYEVAWDYRLRVTQTCEEATLNNPCFATNVCLCDNGYYSIASVMPTMPEDYDGFSEYVLAELGETILNTDVTTDDDDDKILGLDNFMFYAIVGFLVLLIATIGVICCVSKRKSSANTVKP